MAAMFVDGSEQNDVIYVGPLIPASCQISIHLAKQFQRKMFVLFQLIRNKNRLLWYCLLTDQDEMSKFYKEPNINARLVSG